MSEEQAADPQGYKKKQIHSLIEKGMQPYRLKVLKCYDPTYDWKEGTEVTLCQRRTLTPPESYAPHTHTTLPIPCHHSRLFLLSSLSLSSFAAA